jgi:cytidyltransferase-like protein
MEKTKTLVIVSGYFNPVHKGHIEYLIQSKKLGTKLVVIVNNDIQREMKGSKEFMNQAERKYILENIKPVDEVFIAIDEDKMVNKTIEKIYNLYKNKFERFIFANGGDQNRNTVGETKLCEQLGIELADGLGEKIQSSSWLLNKNK